MIKRINQHYQNIFATEAIKKIIRVCNNRGNTTLQSASGAFYYATIVELQQISQKVLFNVVKTLICRDFVIKIPE